MVAQSAHLHVMTNNPTKYEQIPSYDFRDVEFTKCHGQTDGGADHYYVPLLWSDREHYKIGD